MGSLLVLALLMALAWCAIHRQAELAHVSVRDGELLLVRGALPQGLLSELEHALRREARGSFTLQRRSDTPRLLTRGLSADSAQRLRNLLALRRPTEYRSAKPPRQRTLGQRLGWTWLAWRQREAKRRDLRA